jgi:hypothetical protein
MISKALSPKIRKSGISKGKRLKRKKGNKRKLEKRRSKRKSMRTTSLIYNLKLLLISLRSNR